MKKREQIIVFKYLGKSCNFLRSQFSHWRSDRTELDCFLGLFSTLNPSGVKETEKEKKKKSKQ